MCYIELVIAFDGMLSEKLAHWVVSAMLAVLMQRLSVICLDNAVHGGFTSPVCFLFQARRVVHADPVSRASKQPRLARSPTRESAVSDSDENLDLQQFVSLASPATSDNLRLLESSHSSTRVDIRAVRCLGVVRSKGTRKGVPASRKFDLKKGHAVDTTWGPCILKAQCKGGWNCDFRDDHPGGWFVEIKDMLLGAADNI